jgi:flavin reductase (DIM6/NTAB) family NADH-FMN oxidoreductase RutF
MDPEHKKKALKNLTYGLHVLTTNIDGEKTGATVTWLSQASFEPPLIMVGIRADSPIGQAVAKCGTFAISTVGDDQKDLAAKFFKTQTSKDDTLGGYETENAEKTGAPLLKDIPSWFEAKVTDTVDRGDHTVFVAELINAGLPAEKKPLELSTTGWSYGG